MSRLRPLSLRARLFVAVVGGVAVFLTLLTVGFNVFLGSRLRRDESDLLRQRAAAHLATLSTANGRLVVGEAPDDQAPDVPVWIYSHRVAVERPSATTGDQRTADQLAGGPERFADVAQTDTRMYAVPVVRSGRRVGTLVSSVALAPYERTAQTALVGSIIFAVLLLAAIALAAQWAIGAALRPVARMTAEAADRSRHDLNRRFALGEPHDELTRLAATFDELLARIAASVRHEQRLTAEVSHELRTPLTKIITETDLALRRQRTSDAYRESISAIKRTAEQMQRTLETLLSAARADIANGSTSDVSIAIARAVEIHRSLATARGVNLAADTPEVPAHVGVDVDVAERVLAPVLENAFQHARATVRVCAERVNGAVSVTIADDGPGVAADDRERIFEPGMRGHRASGSGVGLGLALARRLARTVGGDVECVLDRGGGAFRIRLPAA